jgi:ABC-type sugar transport system permease subunit
MSTETPPAAGTGLPGRRNPLRALLGLVLLVPASLCCLTNLLLPTLQIFVTSLDKYDLLRPSQFVGLANYAALFRDAVLGPALGFTLLLTVERVLAVALVPPLLALLANEFGRKVRLPLRLLFTIPLALFAPVPLVLGWRIALNPQFGLFGRQSLLGNPALAPQVVLLIDALSTFGLACGIGLVVYLIALRGAGDPAPTWKEVRKPLLVTWVVTLLATVALGLQSLTASFVLTAGGPANRTMTLALYYYRMAFQRLAFGAASAVAAPWLLVLAVLGLAATAIVAGTGLRLETTPRGDHSGLLGPSRRQLASVLLALGLVGSLALCGLGALPYLATGQAVLRDGGSASQMVTRSTPVNSAVLNTIVMPALAILLVQLPVVYLAALGIGALRPLGRRSEWLLLLFGPWLFVGIAPLATAVLERARQMHLLNTSLGLMLPMTFNVLMLFVLTLFFKGQEPKWQAAQAAGQPAGGTFLRSVILPSLPLAALLACISLAIGQQEWFWPMIIANRLDVMTLPLMLIQLSGSFTGGNSPALATELVMFGLPAAAWSFLVIGLFQVFYLDRLALRTADDEPRPPEAPAEG